MNWHFFKDILCGVVLDNFCLLTNTKRINTFIIKILMSVVNYFIQFIHIKKQLQIMKWGNKIMKSISYLDRYYLYQSYIYL